MNTLYLSKPVREQLGACLRPGGEVITQRILKYIRPAVSDIILDAGCGTGATLALLSDKGLCNTIGIDINAGLLLEAQESEQRFLQGDLAGIPLAAMSCDTVFCECAWNLTDKQQVLREFFRV